MKNQTIRYTESPPVTFEALHSIYEKLGWNSIGLTVYELEKMCQQSWYAVYAYDGDKLVGMGRVISDGIITGVICGLCVLPDYQAQGIGGKLMEALVEKCGSERVIPQLMCDGKLVGYYQRLGFEPFTVGMKKDGRR
ncbi:GNAT family N-acetyltransferase [Cytobacillus spongiae]|uniref:GNAT family N-acetyltransferase n=1 Tax=Cytobacillus spongiae TaxID=2901381 RepID=UPI001F427621|nr:GNAT family N-acetyltransferase [Cytobacillus spongiae]UII57575.1 GNAT family N-acetyltransferase [Cytobacillus spongiae]